MKEFILSILKTEGIETNFYFDKLNLLKFGKFETVSIASLFINNSLFTATVKNGISYELNLRKGNKSLLTFNFFDYAECMEMYETIVGKNAALILDSNINACYWKDKINHKIEDFDCVVGSPSIITSFEYEPR